MQQALSCEGQGCSTYLICSNDTDSLCSLKILTVSDQPKNLNLLESPEVGWGSIHDNSSF